MFKEIFATMNEALDELMSGYRADDGEAQREWEGQLAVLKTMSDICMEEWLRFEEKLAECSAMSPVQSAAEALPLKPFEAALEQAGDHFTKGQGYYKLSMFELAVKEFSELVRSNPDFVLGRVYLAMGHLRMGDFGEAYRQFQYAAPLTDHSLLKSVAYHAMGCIQLHNRNVQKARAYFKQAGLTEGLDFL